MSISVAKAKSQDTFNTQGNVWAEALVDKLADTLAELHANTRCDTLWEVEDEALIDTLHNTLLKVKADRLGDCQTDSQHWSCRWLKS